MADPIQPQPMESGTPPTPVGPRIKTKIREAGEWLAVNYGPTYEKVEPDVYRRGFEVLKAYGTYNVATTVYTGRTVTRTGKFLLTEGATAFRTTSGANSLAGEIDPAKGIMTAAFAGVLLWKTQVGPVLFAIAGAGVAASAVLQATRDLEGRAPIWVAVRRMRTALVGFMGFYSVHTPAQGFGAETLKEYSAAATLSRKLGLFVPETTRVVTPVSQ